MCVCACCGAACLGLVESSPHLNTRIHTHDSSEEDESVLLLKSKQGKQAK